MITAISVDGVKQSLARDFPELELQSTEKLAAGMDSTAFIVNGAYTFRFPTRQVDASGSNKRKQQTAAEIKLLTKLNSKLPVVIPEPTYIAPDNAYFGYHYLPGQLLLDYQASYWTKERLNQFLDLTVEVVVKVAEAVPIQEAYFMGLDDFRDVPRRLKELDGLLKKTSLPKWVTQLAKYTCEHFPSQWEAAKSRNVITMHSDLGLTNWLTRDSGDIYALIDWSDAMVAPPEQTFTYWVWEAPENMKRLAAIYKDKTGDEINTQLVYLIKFLDFFAELNCSIANMNEKQISEKMSQLDKWVRGFRKIS